MLALIQNGRKINYLLWGPSESSPIVEKIGSLDCPELKFSNKKIIMELINILLFPLEVMRSHLQFVMMMYFFQT